ncbi:hypothetical protein cypCar_00043503 [Cyprinus carpio]|nr:hypothetical protein cypCar_00043503 [Cyprinus carpio]
MSKLSFRARALDAAKPLPIYRNKDLPDLTDCVSINRAVPQMPTGMEKEEESEHHLQRAISAQQVFREKKESMVIPVPEAESNITYYDRLYKGEFRIPKQLIHIQPLGLDNELPDYDMDSEDETLLNRLNRKMELKPVQFETMMDRLEKASTNQNRKNDEVSYEKMLKLRREFSRTMSILEMIKKREKSKRELLHLTLEVFEKRYQIGDFSGEILNEVTVPLAEKTIYPAPISLPTSNRHKAESKIKSHKSGPKHLHPFTVKPEPYFDFVCSHKKYNKRPKLDTFHQPGRPERQQTINKADIKQYDFHSSGEEDYPLSPASEPDEENDPDGIFAFRRKDGCSYHAPLVDQSCSPHWQQKGQDRLWQRNCLTALSVPRRCIAVARGRVGRGGRVVLDRTSSDLDRALRHLDPDMFYPSADSVVPDLPVHANTNSHNSKLSPQRSLTQLLSDIQACRWKFFHLRPLQDNSRCEDKKGTPQVEKGGATPLSNSVSGNFRQAKMNRSAQSGGGGESGSLLRMTNASSTQLPVPQSLPHGHGHLSTVSAVSPAHTHHSARLCAPSPSALKLASVASSLDRVPKVTPTSAIDIARENHEPERLTLNGLSETTVAMEVT